MQYCSVSIMNKIINCMSGYEYRIMNIVISEIIMYNLIGLHFSVRQYKSYTSHRWRAPGYAQLLYTHRNVRSCSRDRITDCMLAIMHSFSTGLDLAYVTISVACAVKNHRLLRSLCHWYMQEVNTEYGKKQARWLSFYAIYCIKPSLYLTTPYCKATDVIGKA